MAKAKVDSKPAAKPPTKAGSAQGKGKIIEVIEKMSVLELSELVKELEKHFGVTATPQVAAAPAPTAPAVETPAEEKTEFDAILKSYGENKIRVIKVVREITQLGLKESKDLVDDAPKPVKEKVSKEEADSIVKKLEAAGATCEVR